jgi:hypothetical protein
MAGIAHLRDRLCVGPDGFVACPERGMDVDFERCLHCPWFELLNEDPRQGPVWVLCRAPRPRAELLRR